MALLKTAETLRGLGGALGCSWPSDPLNVTPQPAGAKVFIHNLQTLLAGQIVLQKTLRPKSPRDPDPPRATRTLC